MLSRTAQNLFWLGRYIERADATARLTEMGRRMKALLDGGFPYLTAESGGEFLGYAYAGHYRTRPAYRVTVEDSIYIDPKAQRRGVGRALLAALIVESEKRGFRQMLAVIGDSAQTASIELHRAAGFRMVGTFESVGYKFDRWLDSVMMQCALGPGVTTKPKATSKPRKTGRPPRSTASDQVTDCC